MAEIEKKYSDFQKKDCDGFDFDDEGTVDRKLCPTCVPNPNFKLEGYWWEIDNAYLNEAECEYHVRVFDNDPAIKEVIKEKKFSKSRATIEVGIKRILEDIDKPINNKVLDELRPPAYIKEKHRGLETSQTGMARLIAIPAFNFDQIESNDSENAEDGSETESSEEIILDTNLLWRKLNQIGFALYTYGMFYRYLQDDDFVIRQEKNEIERINFELTRKKLISFKRELNDALKASGYAKLNRTGIFKSKRAEKIKIVFKSSGKAFDLKSILALPDTGCSKYEKLKIKRGNPLRKPSMAVIYNFLKNLEKVINDITAKETKPWLDFTLENFYPKYIVDYGNLTNLDERRIGLECLLENQLGIGDGKVIDSLTKEILSAFAKLEKDLATQACRDLSQKAQQSATTISQNGIKDEKEQRKEKMLARYAKEFENKAFEQLKNELENPSSFDTLGKRQAASDFDQYFQQDPTAPGHFIVPNSKQSVKFDQQMWEQAQSSLSMFQEKPSQNQLIQEPATTPQPTQEEIDKFLLENIPQIAPKKYLKYGSKGKEVQKLQKRLNIMDAAGLEEDANFGSLTKAALRSFQKSNVLEDDGVYGPLTKEVFEAKTQVEFINSLINKQAEEELTMESPLEEVVDPEIVEPEEIPPAPLQVTRKNLFDLIKKELVYSFDFPTRFQVTVDYTAKIKGAGGKKEKTTQYFTEIITNEEELKNAKNKFAVLKFNALEEGGIFDQISNSPHFQQAKDAAKEILKNPENTFIQGFKDAIENRGEFDILDTINIFGVCGMSKVAGKALSCLANAVSFDKFLKTLIDKAFDFMEFNTIDLFLNGLPYSFRQDLDAAIEKEFGNGSYNLNQTGQEKTGITLRDVINLIKSDNGQAKVKDITKTKEIAEKLLEILKRLSYKGLVTNLSYEELSKEDKDFVQQSVGGFSTTVVYDVNTGEIIEEGNFSDWDRFAKYFGDSGNYVEATPELEKEKEELLKIIKQKIRAHKRQKNKAAFNRVLQALNPSKIYGDIKETIDETKAAIDETFNISERQRIRLDIQLIEEQIKDDQYALANWISGSSGSNQAPNVLGYTGNQKIEYEKLQKNLVDSQNIKQSLMVQAEAVGIKNTLLETNAGQAISRAIDSTFVTDSEMDQYLAASKSFEQTALGVKVDVVYDLVIDFTIDYIKDSFSLDELYKMMMDYPVVQFVADLIEKHTGECPTAPVIYPPAKDFMKSLSVDFCDPTLSLTMPKISLPSINWRFHIDYQFQEIFREKLIELASNLVIKLLKKLMSTLEGALCKTLNAVGAFAADALKSSFSEVAKRKYNSFLDALNEAFCNNGEDPTTSRSKAEQLAEALFSPVTFDIGADYSGIGSKLANVISSVASKKEFLSAMVAYPGEMDYQFCSRIAAAVTNTVPEAEVLLGDPDQVAATFQNLGSFLTEEDKDNIRDLIDAGIPNLPMSPALCLTNEQLDEWNRYREAVLGDPVSVDDLNRATEAALADIMEDNAQLGDPDGPFIGAATNEALADVCNNKNLINDVSQSDFDRKQQEELVEDFFDNISRILQLGFFGRGGLLSEAMADTEGRIEFWRSFQKFFRPNYTNSDSERQIKYGDKRRIGKWIMDNTDQGEAVGIYPETVAIKQRKQILEEEDGGGKFYYMEDRNQVIYRYDDGEEYTLKVYGNNLNNKKNSFNYRLTVAESIDSNEDVLVDFITPVVSTKEEKDYMASVGFSLVANTSNNPRKELFNNIVKNKIGLNLTFQDLYDKAFISFNEKLVEGLLTDNGDIPVGYKFGYTSDTLTKDSFKYTPSDVEGELGTFGDKRIIALDPKIYGGTYKNPSFYVEPREFTGWFELGKKAFTSSEGCDPKTPPLFHLGDIKQRVKFLSDSLRNDPRLTKDPDCVSIKPFHALIDSKNKSKLDGVIRTTLRTYLGEYFIKGFGLFSNLQIRDDNFDNSMMLYITKMMKKEMSEIGTFTSNRKIRIVRERYWYTFLEQCVEAYQRMIDVDKIEPPEAVFNALNKIQLGLDIYKPIDREIKKTMKNKFPKDGIQKPTKNYNPLQVLNEGMANFCLQAIAFRLTPEDEREDFFNGEIFTDISKANIRLASIKKIKFFQKIYFIKLFEKEATLIMSELIKNELKRLSDSTVNGLTDKPNYYDLSRSIFGMSSIFNGSTSRVGTNPFYLDKQRGVIDTGTVPEVQPSNATCPIPPTEEPQFLIESYVRMEDKVGVDLPSFIRNRDGKYTGIISLSNASAFFDQYVDQMEDKYLSDYFGNLSFTFEGSFKKLLDAGFTSNQDLNRLLELNKETLNIAQLQNARNNYIRPGSREFEDFNVIFDETFLKEGDKFEPKGTKGTTGVKYGLRLSLVFPNTINVQNLTSTILAKSKTEKAYHFEDGSFVLPLVTSEVNVKDCKVEDFDPFYGQEPYDLECLINAMVDNIEFKVIMEKVFNLKQASSMLAIYCMETLAPAIGRDESERTTLDTDPDADDWDKVINKFGKNFLRKEFKSIYLSSHEDGQGDDDDDEDNDEKRMSRFTNPFDFLTLPSVKIPWFRKRRMKLSIYDKNGEECANPKKDLE